MKKHRIIIVIAMLLVAGCLFFLSRKMANTERSGFLLNQQDSLVLCDTVGYRPFLGMACDSKALKSCINVSKVMEFADTLLYITDSKKIFIPDICTFEDRESLVSYFSNCDIFFGPQSLRDSTLEYCEVASQTSNMRLEYRKDENKDFTLYEGCFEIQSHFGELSTETNIKETLKSMDFPVPEKEYKYYCFYTPHNSNNIGYNMVFVTVDKGAIQQIILTKASANENSFVGECGIAHMMVI